MNGVHSGKPISFALLCVLGALRAHGAETTEALTHERPGSRRQTETGPFGRVRPVSPPAQPPAEADPPLWDDLGTLHYPITTPEPLAQRYFDQGVRLAYAFNHDEARRAFRAAQRHDPNCAMCYWGEAFVLGPNINAPMEPAAFTPALAAIARAAALKAGHTSAREQSLIDALRQRYAATATSDRVALDRAYADAMARAAASFPDDDDIATWYAEALMDLSPWDYWEQGGGAPKHNTREIVATLEKVLRRNPQHPGAIHLYIHMVEASNDPKRAEPYADHLAAKMSGAGHMVHMPSHIYYRVGRYRDSLESNRAAVRVDEDYIAGTPADGLYPRAYYPHNLHFLMVSAQMAGDGPTAIAASDKLARTLEDTAVRTVPWVQPIKAAPYFVHLQFSQPATVFALRDPGDQFPYVKGLWHHARGVAHARAGHLPAAEQEAMAISRLAWGADFTDLNAGGVPAREVLLLAEKVLRARIAQAQQDLKSARKALEDAVSLEDQLPYLEPPYWYSPVRQSLGAIELLDGDAKAAERTFRATLERTPNNAWALFGLAEALRRQGRSPEAADARQHFDRAWLGQQGPPALEHL